MSVPPSNVHTRSRVDSLRLDDDKRTKIANRVKKFFETDMTDRDVDREQRLQRYAKYRMWTSRDDGPWENSSDVALSDMTEKSLRMQDTLNNAVMAQRPAVNANAIHEANKPKEKPVDALLDYQFFVEQPGELTIGDLADAFINDGTFVAFVPWVKERRKTSQVYKLPGIPGGADPATYFSGVLRNRYPRANVIPKGNGWSYRVTDAGTDEGGNATSLVYDIECYTRGDGNTEMVIKGDITVYDGPRVIIKDYDDVFHPVRAANLQPPGPHNPGGAQHVILRDHPTIDEIRKLHKSGVYDLMTEEQAASLENYARGEGSADDAEEQQRDDLAGKNENATKFDDAPSHNTLTRLICFDRYDIDGDGLDEDVIFWTILEPRILVRAKVLQEVYPLRPDRPRPLAEATLFPVRGRRVGFSMLELLEGIHDAMKMTMDQTFDANTIGIVPWWFYRPTSNMKSEVIRLGPGEGFPLNDPQRDVHMPQIGNPQAQGMSLNLITILQQLSERVAVVGDMQLGRVPAGKSSALRTVGGMSLLAGQGEARPERILRRFFNGLVQVYEIMHELNEYHLPKNKRIRTTGPRTGNDQPYMDLGDGSAVRGKFIFDFSANVFNTAKAQMQESLQLMLGTYVNALTIQLGVATPETVYNLLRDFGQAHGINPETKRYINPPTPGLLGPRILAEEATVMILDGERPKGTAMEAGGWVEHLQKLIDIEGTITGSKEDTGDLTPEQARLWQEWKVHAQQQAAVQQQQTQMMAAAEQMSQSLRGGGGAGGRPPEQPPPDATSNPQVSGGNELIDETMPGAGGGAQ